jgi:Tat protein translocase TatB subunit
MLNIGPQELLLILVVALIVVGPRRLPEIGRSIGKGLREIRRVQDEVKQTVKDGLDEPPADNGARGTRGVTRSEPAAAAGDGAPVGDPVPTASEPVPASDVREISRTLGASLAELKRAKQEVQRSFRVDLPDPARSTPERDRPAAPRPPEPAPSADASPGSEPVGG